MSPDLAHAIVAGLIIGLLVLGVDHSGVLDGKSKGQRFLLVFAIGFVLMLILNVLWPG